MMTQGVVRYILVTALVGLSVVSSQDFTVDCGKTARNTVISDTAVQATGLRKTLLPTMKQMFCNFGATPYCSASKCVLDGMVRDGKKDITIQFSSNVTSKEGGGFTRGPCTKVMDSIFSQCIDGPKKVSSGSAATGNIAYRIQFGTPDQALSNANVQKRRASPGDIPLSELPPGLRNLPKGTTTSTRTSTPTPTPLGGGTPNTANCQSDVDGIIANLNANYGDTIDLDRDQSKMADFVRGPDNKGDNDWWRLTSFGHAFLVFGKDASRRGFSGDVGPIQKSQLIDFVNQRKLFYCINANPKLVASPGQSRKDGKGHDIGFQQICLADFENYQKCSGRVG